jgi:NTE family protein
MELTTIMNSKPLDHKHKSLGLVLGGGGARGLAHIGVLKVLAEQNIEISYISGCSMGGLVGALYALGFSIKEIEEIAIKYTSIREMINIVDRSPHRRGLIVGNRLRSMLSKIIDKDIKFSDAKIPITLASVDLMTSREITLSEGILLDAVMATIAIPGIFAPVSIDGMLLTDGGSLNNLPVSQLIESFNPEVSLAIDVHPELNKEIPWQVSGQKPRIVFPIPDFFLDFYQSQLIMISSITESNLQKSRPSYLIRPDLPPEITMFYGYQHAARIIKMGEDSARKNLSQIRDLLF